MRSKKNAILTPLRRGFARFFREWSGAYLLQEMHLARVALLAQREQRVAAKTPRGHEHHVFLCAVL